MTRAFRRNCRNDSFMDILLQSKGTLHYVENHTGWTTRVDEARVFATGLEAIFFCLNHQMVNMQILGRFTDERMNFTVPVTDTNENASVGAC